MNKSPITILLVEDDPAHAEIVIRNLATFPVPYRLFHVGDGQLAMDYLLRENDYADPHSSPLPDLILLDLHLPKVEGLEVLRRVKESEILKGIPTVVLTTSSDSSDLAAASRLGAASYQLKPASFEGFTELFESGCPLFPTR
jgi:CheY-like chemotaxis protein